MHYSIPAALAGAAIAATVGFAGGAHADVYGYEGDHNAYAYLLELNSEGVGGTAAQARSLALDVCTTRAGGVSEARLRHNLEEEFPVGAVVSVVMGAEWHFCPVYESAA